MKAAGILAQSRPVVYRGGSNDVSFFEELKRRNVFRVGIAYVITAWVLIQVLDIFLPTFGAPEWVMKVIWAFEMTPEGIKRDGDVDPNQSITPQTGKKLNHAIMGLMAVAIAFLLLERFWEKEQGPEPYSSDMAAQEITGDEENRALTPEVSTPDENSIAVLPFDNRSNNEEDAFFVEGVHDDLPG